MGVLSDRIMMTIMVVTGVAGLVGYVLTVAITELSSWYVRNVLPFLAAIFFVALLLVVWEGLDLMD